MDTNTTPATLNLSDRDSVIRIIRAELRRRSGKAWTVKSNRGTASSWITITAPPARREGYRVTDADAAELGELLGLGHPETSVSIPPQDDYRMEYVDRARGLSPVSTGVPEWD